MEELELILKNNLDPDSYKRVMHLIEDHVLGRLDERWSQGYQTGYTDGEEVNDRENW